MKRILFVADFNDTAHCIQEAMLSRYQVQLCSMKNAEDENAEHKDISDVSNYIENEDKIKNKTDIWDDAELDNEADVDKRKHILLVDNDDEIYNNMKSIIGDRYRVSVAGTELQAMRMLEKDRPDMMFLSYEMLLCEGRIMLEMIRNDEELRKLPVVFLTKIAEKRNIASIIRLKPAGCILKPLDKGIVTRIIEKCMDAKLEV